MNDCTITLRHLECILDMPIKEVASTLLMVVLSLLFLAWIIWGIMLARE